MKKNTKIIYISEIILFIYIVLLSLFINNISNEMKNISSIVVLSVLLIFLLTFFGAQKDNNFLKDSSARIVTASLMMFMIIIYGLGIITGFYRGYSINDYNTLFRVLIPIIIIILELEIVRFVLLKNCFKNKKAIIIFTVLSSILNIILELNLGTLGTKEDRFIFLSTMIFPIIAEEALCSYMTYKISMLPSIIYKLVIKLYFYILPIVPNLGDYVYSVINIIFPFAIYSILNKMVIKYEKEKEKLKKVNRVIFTIPLIIAFIILMILVSGIFKYKMIAIASNSMKPVFSRGDTVIYEKIDIKELEVGDVLVFQKDNIIVTHRITKIWKQNDKYYFITKGDNNNTEDQFTPKEENVLGKVNIVLKYIGYPTVLINEFFGKE